jgi:hypothetical protein
MRESMREPTGELRRWRAAPGRFALLAIVCAVAGAACGDRERPTGLDDDGPTVANLIVEVISPPDNNAPHPIGSTVPITIRARELNGRLVGVGYEARLGDFQRTLIDSLRVEFAPLRDTVVDFEFVIPDSLPASVQINLTGVAFAENGARLVSDDHAISTSN